MNIISKLAGFLNVKDGLERKEISEMMIGKPISDYLLPAAYDEELKCYLCRDNTIGFLFECFPKPVAGEDTIRILQGLYSSMYIPENSIIQVSLWASDYIEPFIKRFESLRNSGPMGDDVSRWLKAITDFHIKQKREGTSPEVPVPLRNFRLFFSFKLPMGVKDYNTKTKDIELIYSNIKSALDTANFYPNVVTPEDYLKVIFLMLNPNHDTAIMPEYDPDSYIYKQVVHADSDTRVQRNFTKYDSVYGKAITVKHFPEEVSISDGLVFTGDNLRNEVQITCPFIVTLTLLKMGDKLKRALEQKAEFLYKQKLASSMSVKLQMKQDESQWVIEKLVDGNTIMKGFVTWWLYHDKADVVQKNAQTLKYLLDIKGFKLQEEIYSMNLSLLLYGSLPMNASHEADQVLLKRGRTMFDFNAAHLSPVQAEWKGTGTPAVLFKSRKGQIQCFNLFDGSEGFNAIIAGQTGAGKSLATLDIINSYLSVPSISNIWIIDVGESYKELCRKMNGLYLDFREDGDFVINPFSDCTDLREDMDLFIALISKMAKPTENVNDTEKAVIEEAIRLTFLEYGNETNIDRLIETLQTMATNSDGEFPKKNAATVIATNLFRWSTQGSYGKYFNGKNNIDLGHKMVVLELKNLSHREDLRNVVLMVIFYHISKVIYIDDDKSKKKLLIFDEAWQFFDDYKIAKFIEKAYRTFRKHGSAAVTVTQAVDDFYKNESTREIMFQASNWLLLKQKPESINRLRREERVILNDHEFEALENIRTVKGKYSEIFFVTPMGRGIGRLIVPPSLYWIYTTDAAEVSKRKDMIEQFGSEEGIEKCIETCG